MGSRPWHTASERLSSGAAAAQGVADHAGVTAQQLPHHILGPWSVLQELEPGCVDDLGAIVWIQGAGAGSATMPLGFAEVN